MKMYLARTESLLSNYLYIFWKLFLYQVYKLQDVCLPSLDEHGTDILRISRVLVRFLDVTDFYSDPYEDWINAKSGLEIN